MLWSNKDDKVNDENIDYCPHCRSKTVVNDKNCIRCENCGLKICE